MNRGCSEPNEVIINWQLLIIPEGSLSGQNLLPNNRALFLLCLLLPQLIDLIDFLSLISELLKTLVQLLLLILIFYILFLNLRFQSETEFS